MYPLVIQGVNLKGGNSMRKDLIKIVKIVTVGGLIVATNSLVGCSTTVKNEVVNNINSNEELNENISNKISEALATEEGFVVPETSITKLVYTQDEYNNMTAWLNFKNIGVNRIKLIIYGTINQENFEASTTVLDPVEQENIKIGFKGAVSGRALGYDTEEIKINKIIVRELSDNDYKDYPINVDLVIDKNDTKVKILNDEQFQEENKTIKTAHISFPEVEKVDKEENKKESSNEDRQEEIKKTLPVYINKTDASYHRIGGCNSRDYIKVTKEVAEKQGKKACPICCGSNY